MFASNLCLVCESTLSASPAAPPHLRLRSQLLPSSELVSRVRPVHYHFITASPPVIPHAAQLPPLHSSVVSTPFSSSSQGTRVGRDGPWGGPWESTRWSGTCRPGQDSELGALARYPWEPFPLRAATPASCPARDQRPFANSDAQEIRQVGQVGGGEGDQ